MDFTSTPSTSKRHGVRSSNGCDYLILQPMHRLGQTFLQRHHHLLLAVRTENIIGVENKTKAPEQIANLPKILKNQSGKNTKSQTTRKNNPVPPKKTSRLCLLGVHRVWRYFERHRFALNLLHLNADSCQQLSCWFVWWLLTRSAWKCYSIV